MKTEDYINDFVEKEKQTELNPFLAIRIMSEIEKPIVQRKLILWQNIAIAASVALVILVGVQLGDIYTITQKQYTGTNINDSEIENFTYYNSENNE